MNAATLIPAVLFYRDRDGQLREAYTRAAEHDCDAVDGAALLSLDEPAAPQSEQTPMFGD